MVQPQLLFQHRVTVNIRIQDSYKRHQENQLRFVVREEGGIDAAVNLVRFRVVRPKTGHLLSCGQERATMRVLGRDKSER